MNILTLKMLFPYISLAFVVLCAHRSRPAFPFLIATQLVIAYVFGVVNLQGFSALIIFLGICELHSRNFSSREWLNSTVIFIKAAIALCFASHIVPGFHNLLVLNNVKFSPSSSLFNMYLNFDKTMAAVILAASTAHIWKGFNLLHKEFVKDTLVISLLCIAVIMPLAVLSGYVHYDPKFPPELWLWALNNLLFVCFAEEVIFRGVIQNRLMQIARRLNMPTFIPIFLTALLFGTAHLQGGMMYISLATIGGLFFGYAFHKTGRLVSSIIVHFLLNLTHFLLFTYPAAAVMVR
jgi:membrane protease YdiL (CAAX protease family)